MNLRSAILLSVTCFSMSPERGQADTEVLKLGAETFSACVACHGADGKGVNIEALSMAPSLHDSEWVRAANPDVLALLVMKGIKKEDDSHMQQMLALEAALDDEELGAVLTYVRNTFGGHSDLVTPKRIERLRKEYKAIPPLVTRDFLGKMGILSRIVGLQDLSFEAYLGDFKSLPDFDALEATSSGDIPGSLINLDITTVDKGKGFGAVFAGTLEIPVTGTYYLVLRSDDGSRLILDGEVEINNDGIHPAKSKAVRLPLEEGLHTVRVEYFDGGGERNLAFAIRPQGVLAYAQLSRQQIGASGGGQKVAATPIPLLPENEGEAVLYRNFIEGAQPRAIGVGYPGGFNLCWDADTYNVSLLWRGDFVDASRHWTGRGQGAQPPMGTDVVQPAEGMALQILASPETVWEPFSTAEIPYIRDKPDSGSNLISYNDPHPSYRFLGYSLNDKRFPTFRYSFEGMKVQDFITPSAPSQGMLRTLRFSGEAPANTYFRVATGMSEDGIGGFKNDSLTVQIEGGSAVIRNGNLLVLVTGAEQSLQVTYTW